MFRYLGAAQLASGEEFVLGVVEAPDPAWADQLVPFLAHKPSQFRFHIERALHEPLDDLHTRFYVGLLGGKVVTQVMIVGSRGIGILGHVFTLPSQRRNGAYRALIAAQVRDCVALGFRIITLTTGYDSPPYHIYRGFGFRPIVPGSGHMNWTADRGDEQRYWQRRAPRVRPARWDDWAQLCLLTVRPFDPGEETPRSFHFEMLERGMLEGPYLTLRSAMHRDHAIKAWVLEDADAEGRPGAIAGMAVVGPEPHSFGSLRRLDTTIHPRWSDRLPELVAAAIEPGSPLVAYAAPGGERASTYAEAGFRPVATLPGWLPTTPPSDVTVLRQA